MTTATIGDVAQYVNGAAFKESDWEDDGRRIIRIQNLNDPTKPYNRTTKSVKDSIVVRRGDLLVSWSASLGVYEWTEPDEAVLNQHIFRVIPDEEVVDRQYLRRVLAWSIDQLAGQAHGATMKHLTRKVFLRHPIPLPPIEEQRRIAAVLDAADDLRTKRRQALAKLDTLTQAIFIDMFGDPLVDGATNRLDEIVSFVGGGTPSKSVAEYFQGDICWATSKDMKSPFLDDTQDHITEAAIANSATKLVPVGSVLVVVKSKVLAHTLPVAIAGVPTCFGQDLKAAIPIEGVQAEFVAAALRAAERWLLARARGINTEGLTLDELRRVPVSIGNCAERRNFSKLAVSTENQRKRVLVSLIQEDALFASLQQRAFSGEL